jgi:hypothetical protein
MRFASPQASSKARRSYIHLLIETLRSVTRIRYLIVRIGLTTRNDGIDHRFILSVSDQVRGYANRRQALQH